MSIYDSVILDLYHHPLNKRVMEHPHASCHVENVSCGDDMTLMFMHTDGCITDCSFVGHACAVSTASASLLTEKVRGMSLEAARSLSANDVQEMLEIPLSPIRLKCALLPLEALHSALRQVLPK